MNVIAGCKNIDAKHTLLEPEWHEQVNALQTWLADRIPPRLWDPMCEAVYSLAAQEKHIMNDCSVVYAALINAYTKRLKVKYIECRTDSVNAFYEHFDVYMLSSEWKNDWCECYCYLWLKLIPKMVNLLELDTSQSDEKCHSVRRTETEEYFDLILKSCPKLQIFYCSLCFTEEQLSRILTTLPDLRETNHSLGYALQSPDIVGPLKLRSYRQIACTRDEIVRMIDLCPYLTSLHISVSHDESSEIFHLLKHSSLKLDNLILEEVEYVDIVLDFLRVKG